MRVETRLRPGFKYTAHLCRISCSCSPGVLCRVSNYTGKENPLISSGILLFSSECLETLFMFAFILVTFTYKVLIDIVFSF